jgi:hypothetical protein
VKEELINIFEEDNVTEISYRSGFDLIQQFIVTCTSFGLFTGLWKIYEFAQQKKNNTKIKITYTSQKGENIDIEMSNLSKKDVEDVLSKHLPKEENILKVILTKHQIDDK